MGERVAGVVGKSVAVVETGQQFQVWEDTENRVSEVRYSLRGGEHGLVQYNQYVVSVFGLDGDILGRRYMDYTEVVLVRQTGGLVVLVALRERQHVLHLFSLSMEDLLGRKGLVHNQQIRDVAIEQDRLLVVLPGRVLLYSIA